MPGIIEIWRKTKELGIPVKFTVGEPPAIINADGVLEFVEGPNVKAINASGTGAFGNKGAHGRCYVVQFEDSKIRRIIPAETVVDIGYEIGGKNDTITPALPEE